MTSQSLLTKFPRNSAELVNYVKVAANHVTDHVIPRPRNNYSPLALHRRPLVLLSLFLILVKIAVTVLLIYGPTFPALSSAITGDNIFSLTNQARADYGAGTLTLNNQLNVAAQAKADDMLAKQYFSHNTPDGKTPWDFVTASGYSYVAAGENLGVNFLQAEEVSTAWMNSPGHRANILNSTFKEIGIGISSGQFQGNSVTFVVEMFGTPPAKVNTQTASPPAPAPTAPPTSPAAGVGVVPTASIGAANPKPAAAPAPPKPVPPPVKPVLPPAPVQTEPGKLAPPAPTAPGSAPISFKVSLRGESNTLKNPSADVLSDFAIFNSSVEINNQDVNISVQTSGAVEKVQAVFGKTAIAFTASDNTWRGSIPLSKFDANPDVIIQAFDSSGHTKQLQLASFSATAVKNYSPYHGSQETLINLFGFHLNPTAFQQTFFSLQIALLLGVLTIAIAIRPKIQHVSLIGHTAVVIMLASILWVLS